MKKSILTFLLGGLTVLALGAVLPESTPNIDADPAQGQSPRFELRDTQDVIVVDTWTGEVWRHLTDWKSIGKPGE